MLRALLCFLLLAGIFVLPLVGATLSQAHPLAHYAHFPPEILRTYPKFSLPGTLLIALLPAAFVLWMLVPHKLGFRRTSAPPMLAPRALP